MKNKIKKNQRFFRELLPKKKEQEDNVFTLKPRLKKRLIIRKRKSGQAFLRFMKEVQEKREFLAAARNR